MTYGNGSPEMIKPVSPINNSFTAGLTSLKQISSGYLKI
jgi:hypothetical protein